jgi:hypothetical protein
VSDDDAFDAYRKQIERTLQLAREQLTPVSQDRIRHAVRVRRRDRDDAERMLVGTAAEQLGVPLLAGLDDADRELSHDEVAELVKLIEAGLASPD